MQCAVRHPTGALVNHYHSFTQASRMDRQETRLLFEQGDVRLHGWIPTQLHIDAIVDESAAKRLTELFPGARYDVTAYYQGNERNVNARHRTFDVYERLSFHWGEETLKLHRYGELIRSFCADQIAWVRDPSHPRTTTEENGRQSLVMALNAARLADSPN